MAQDASRQKMLLTAVQRYPAHHWCSLIARCQPHRARAAILRTQVSPGYAGPERGLEGLPKADMHLPGILWPNPPAPGPLCSCQQWKRGRLITRALALGSQHRRLGNDAEPGRQQRLAVPPPSTTWRPGT